MDYKIASDKWINDLVSWTEKRVRVKDPKAVLRNAAATGKETAVKEAASIGQEITGPSL